MRLYPIVSQLSSTLGEPSGLSSDVTSVVALFSQDTIVVEPEDTPHSETIAHQELAHRQNIEEPVGEEGSAGVGSSDHGEH